MRAFLDESYDRKLKVLSYIDNQRKIVSIKNISENTNLSEKTVLQIIRQFEQEFSPSSGQFQISYVNKTIKGIFAENLDVMSIAATYLKESILYKIIYNIFLYEKVDVKKFCELEYISASTFSRYRQKLASILKKFDLKLSRVNKIAGDELKIRNFFFLFFSHASNHWVFNSQEYREIEANIYKKVKSWSILNNAKQARVCLLIYISNIRSSQKHNCNNGILVELSQKSEFDYKEALVEYFSSKKNRSQEQIWQEISFVQLFMYKEDLVTEKINFEEYTSFFNEENFPFVENSNQLTEQIIETFFSSFTGDLAQLFLRIRQEIDKMHLVLSTCYIDTNIFSYIYDPINCYYRDKTEEEVIEAIKQIFDNSQLSQSYKNWWMELNIDESSLLEYVYWVVYMLLNEIQEYTFPPVKVMVQNSKFFAETIIANKLVLVFTDRIQLVSDLRDQPDVLITDIYLPEVSENTRVVFANSFFSLSDFNKVIDEIKQEIIKKYSHRTIVHPLSNIS
ncbi:helix-turn-helix domain-containing protein [Enterococcus quebecensis]|uniref:Mga helix-turn-helix domain-containing protein n=1 Tax=Enterococcus quebecensis TaxID=903983 RepID=A0A1E5GSJ1_9ENTE|nr:helix-turn-helix domain-containing protein [Enterococcus quebecensis]OEG15190.1 hypothetical protein BCR23_10155 [Enterococcus quebecensis]OJG74768.1 hypothetical protein RV12_GL002185 [Enterococcus quebecensis]